MDALNRSCVVSAHFGSHRVHLVVKFPAQYPNNAAPSFQFIPPTTIPSAMKTKIQKVAATCRLHQKVPGYRKRFVTHRLPTGPDRHVPAEGEEDAELSGALRPSAGVLSGVGHGEETSCVMPCDVLSVFPTFNYFCLSLPLLCQTQEDGSTSGPFMVTPALQAFPRVTNTYGSYQVRNHFVPATFHSSL